MMTCFNEKVDVAASLVVVNAGTENRNGSMNTEMAVDDALDALFLFNSQAHVGPAQRMATDPL